MNRDVLVENYVPIFITLFLYLVAKPLLIAAFKRVRACLRGNVESVEVPPPPEEANILPRQMERDLDDDVELVPDELILVGT